MNINEISIDKRPREKAFLYGFNSLNDYELLAILIGSGTKKLNAIEISTKLLNKYKTFSEISNLSFEELSTLHGIGKIKALKLAAIFEVYKRLKKEYSFMLDFKIINAENFVKYARNDIDFEEKELLYVYIIDNKNYVKKIEKYQGFAREIEINIVEVFKMVMKNNYSKCLFVHTHLIDDSTPSILDINFFEKAKTIAKMLNLKLIDNIIVAKSSYFSFFEEKLF